MAKAMVPAFGRVTEQTENAPALLRRMKQPLFDTMEMPAAAAATSSLIFFQAPQGAALNVTGGVKGLADSNMSQSSSIGKPMEMLVYGFNMTLTYVTGYRDHGGVVNPWINFVNDLSVIYQSSVFKFKLGSQKVYCMVPLSRIPHGAFFLSGAVATADDNGAAAGDTVMPISNGVSDKREFFKHANQDGPTLLSSTETFNVNIEWPNAPAGLSLTGAASRLTVFLVGVLGVSL